MNERIRRKKWQGKEANRKEKTQIRRKSIKEEEKEENRKEKRNMKGRYKLERKRRKLKGNEENNE